MNGGSEAKRKLGGHFGAAVGSSTNAKKTRGGWRDEVEPEEDAAQAATGSNGGAAKMPVDDNSDSEEMLDPGTPLPSEDEAEEQPSLIAVPAEVDADAPRENGAQPEDAAGKPADEPPAAEVPAAVTGEAHSAPKDKQVTVSLELVVGGTPSGTVRVLLRNGLNADTEARLLALATYLGAPIEAIAGGALCILSGHPALTCKRRLGDGKVGQGMGDSGDNDGGAGSSGSTAPAGESTMPTVEGVQHSSAGFLTAPKEGPGLALTLGPQPQLDATHTVIGPVIIGRRALRRIEALAPLSGEFAPRESACTLFLRALSGETVAAAEDETNGNAEQVEGVKLRGKLLLAPAGAAADQNPFFLERLDEVPASDEIDIIELDLNGRDAEMQELKAMPFNRERAEGVAAVENALANAQDKMKSFFEQEDLEQAVAHQCEWQQERARHLERILRKLK